jgi:HNH endonuclease
MKKIAPLTLKCLREVLDYNPETGIFTWKVSRGRLAKAYSQAGTKNAKGYIEIKVFGKTMKAHRLAWLFTHGISPVDQIDHINMIKDDNRIINLREATQVQNMQNRVKATSVNRLGVLGIRLRSTGSYEARIRHNGKVRQIGNFETLEAAKAAYLEAKRKFHPFNTL